MRTKSSETKKDSGETKAAKVATVRSIAKRLGLSPATVSLALNGQRPMGFVSPETRNQVWMTAQEMGYPMTRLRSRRPPIERVAIFADTGRGAVYYESLLMLCRLLNQKQIQALTRSPLSDSEALSTALDLYRRQEIDAAVFVGSRRDANRRLSQEDINGMPHVFVGEVPPGSTVWQARADNEGGGYLAGEHLWSLGHRSVSVLLPETDPLIGTARLNGLRAFWREQGRDIPDEDVIWITSGNASLIREATARLAREKVRRTTDPVTALFCFNDWIAGTVLKALHTLSIRIPDDLAVVGFDDSIYTDLLDPSLTSVHQPFDILGELTAELLFTQVESPGPHQVKMAPCSLIVRESTVAK